MSDTSGADAAASQSFAPSSESSVRSGADRRLVIVLCGLPARGKTYISRKLTRYLCWLGYSTRCFNIGNYRREKVGASMSSDFFDPTNSEFVKARNECALSALSDMFSWFRTAAGQVGIYDGTNSTRSRRAMVAQEVHDMAGQDLSVDILWLESICDDQDLIEQNIRETKLFSPDYTEKSAEEAIQDFRRRIQNYEKAYEPLDDKEAAYIQLINCGARVIANRVNGYLQGRILFYLMNLQIHKNPIYLCRHGESTFNLDGRIGGDPPLTHKGAEYALNVGTFIIEQMQAHTAAQASFAATGATYSSTGVASASSNSGVVVWCSTLQRATQTAELVSSQLRAGGIAHARPTQWRALTEIEVGRCDGLTYDQIYRQFPQDWAARAQDKLRFRYPRGESYLDVIHRLEPVIFELERLKVPAVVVCHRAVMRCLMSYFLDLPHNEIPHLDIPMHTVIKLVPRAYSCELSAYKVPPFDAKDSLSKFRFSHSVVHFEDDEEQKRQHLARLAELSAPAVISPDPQETATEYNADPVYGVPRQSSNSSHTSPSFNPVHAIAPPPPTLTLTSTVSLPTPLSSPDLTQLSSSTASRYKGSSIMLPARSGLSSGPHTGSSTMSSPLPVSPTCTCACTCVGCAAVRQPRLFGASLPQSPPPIDTTSTAFDQGASVAGRSLLTPFGATSRPLRSNPTTPAEALLIAAQQSIPHASSFNTLQHLMASSSGFESVHANIGSASHNAHVDPRVLVSADAVRAAEVTAAAAAAAGRSDVAVDAFTFTGESPAIRAVNSTGTDTVAAAVAAATAAMSSTGSSNSSYGAYAPTVITVDDARSSVALVQRVRLMQPNKAK